MMMERCHIHPGNVKGSIRIPSSKSLCHRAIICAALAEGTSTVKNVTFSEDILATIQIMEQLGAKITCGEDSLVVEGNGGRFLAGEARELFCNESGSTLRFLIPIAACLGVQARFTGAAKLPERPLSPYYDVMEAQGAKYQRETEAHLPIVIQDPWKSGVYQVAGNISSQFITGLLLGLTLLKEDSVIEVTTKLESKPYVDLTIDVMEQFGIRIKNQDYKRFVIPGGQHYQAQDYTVEGDYSQAAFFLVAGSVAAAEEGLTLLGMRQDSHQGDKVILDLLDQMGAQFTWQDDGSLLVHRAEALQGTVMDAEQCPDLVPIAAVLGALSAGQMQIVHAERLRYKESDRLKAITTELNACGASVQETEDGLLINGIGVDKNYPGGDAKGWTDHRIAMSMAVLALRTEQGVRLTGADCVKKSWPSFWEDLIHTGGVVDEW